MRQNPSFTLGDPEEIKRTHPREPVGDLREPRIDSGLVASHYPVLLDESRDGAVASSPTSAARMSSCTSSASTRSSSIVQGPHGYISPGWYDAEPGRADLELRRRAPQRRARDPQRRREPPGARPARRPFRGPACRTRAAWRARSRTPQYAERISSGTVGLRLTPTRVVAKSKMSQNRPGRDRRPHHVRARGRRAVRERGAAPPRCAACTTGCAPPDDAGAARRARCPAVDGRSTCWSRDGARSRSWRPTGRAARRRRASSPSTVGGSSPGSGTTTCTSRSGRRPRAGSTCRRRRSAARGRRARARAGRRRAPATDRIVGFGFHDALWPDVPTRELLDARGGPPGGAHRGDLHCCWLNSAAARRLAPGRRRRRARCCARTRASPSPALLTRRRRRDARPLGGRRRAGRSGARGRRHRRPRVRLEPRRLDSGAWRAGADSLRVEFGIYGDHLDRAADARPAHGRRRSRAPTACSPSARSRSSPTARSTPAPPSASTPTRTAATASRT